MLQLKNIVKSYLCGEEHVPALNGISVTFRSNEFVAVLGPSGCGKTTLLNIVGGLDRYDSGDLIINGRPTAEYNDADWDLYRNHSVGFVFQSYNLIPHQTVLSNVELALTLSGVSPEERRRRAVQALQEVGLGNQLKKRPNQMSGGQMQRVAIARALVNDPDILLADEPTGALDSSTSEQIMALLSKVAEHKLVVMVTHNASLAEKYATRTVRMLDGHVTGDTDPFEAETGEDMPHVPQKIKHARHRSMSFFTALQLSFQNLMTKKARTVLTAIAGSIGIIGIALILALSTGVTRYINNVQEKTLASYPLEIERNPTSISGMISAMMKARTPQGNDGAEGHDLDAVYLNSVTYELMNSMIDSASTENNLVDFKTWLEREHDPATSSTGLDEAISTIQYSYDLPIDTYVPNDDGTYRNASYSALYSNMFSADYAQDSLYSNMGSQFTAYSVFSELLPGETRGSVNEVIKTDYEMVYGEWPTAANELVLVLSEDNEVSDITLYSLGLISEERMLEVMKSAVSGTPIEIKDESWSYEDICAASMRLLPPCDRYTDSDGDGIFTYVEDGSDMLSLLVKDAMVLKVVGIIRPGSSSDSPMLNGSLCYTAALTDEMLAHTADSAVYRAQTESPDTDVLNGLPFTVETDSSLDDEEKRAAFLAYAAALNDEEKAKLYQKILALPDEAELEASLETYLEPYKTRADMEKLIADSYGADNGTVLSYLASYTDDELREMLRTTFRNMLESQYETAAQATIDKIAATPSEEELSVIAARIRATLQDRNTIVGYILSQWTTDTAMPANIAMQYLATLPDTQLESVLNDAVRRDAAALYASSLSAAADKSGAYRKCAAAFDAFLGGEIDIADAAAWYDAFMPTGASDSTYANNLSKIGSADSDNPASILLYAKTFAAKEKISDGIDAYNAAASEEDVIEYTDYVALIMSSVTTVINAISYVLIAFVAISLLVSSIMIGIITYISVLERTKEIGILRAIGASKRDVSRVFNAETLIVGFCAGAIGILTTLLLTIPINLIVHQLTGISEINAYLPPAAAVVLIVISMILTLCAGIIPSCYAASKDPVVALRTE